MRARVTETILPANKPEVWANHPLRVGIPRTVGFYEHGAIWARMFALLDCEVVLSSPTDQSILNAGVRATATEFCLPIKVLTGHVLALADKVDVIFLPRYLSSMVGEMSCPKACALPDVARFCLGQSVEVLEAAIDPDRFSEEQEAVVLGPVAERLGLAEEIVRAALAQAKREQKEAERPTASSDRTIALLGHPYVLEDPYISMGLAGKLRKHGFGTIMPRDLPYQVRRADVHPYDGKAFYTIGLDVLGAAHAFARRQDVCGMIYLTPFGCGIDALAASHVEQHLRNGERRMPFMKLTVDEQTGEAGFDTRIEAFLDMMGEES
ncbi:acyl-CoA dehydratase activase-related protein [Ethanoligenens sp.]|uniref:acyl-CoA dehydratase activase-related protein n=1 Tax=Ethanoligenens sp. TaxID=2099655 RepID=UPI0039E9BBD8